MKLLLTVLKRATFALAILYGFNLTMNALNMFIPINVYTVSTVGILGFPGLFLLVGLSVVI